MGNMTRSLAMICVFSVQVRVVAPFLGPPSDYAVVKMIPNEKLPPRNLHRVRVDKTQATLKWQPPYDSPSKPLVHSCLLLWWCQTIRTREIWRTHFTLFNLFIFTVEEIVGNVLTCILQRGSGRIVILSKQCDHSWLFLLSQHVGDVSVKHFGQIQCQWVTLKSVGHSVHIGFSDYAC